MDTIHSIANILIIVGAALTLLFTLPILVLLALSNEHKNREGGGQHNRAAKQNKKINRE